ncbi:hypothetical protein WICPIJ_000659 [Wickerhamomyces pijperi]|uniref:glycogenin glucosyltransferase n=1 Tax=Wickerhamomyces pijperi TaxID=599730 RepID=A0A9P8TQM7_WICPI|nr:hypothetical protein WICPIJ_000659 [Wickerhamomyces pijperi]
MTNAIATLLFSASYLPGALILSKTLRQLGVPSDVKLVVLLAATLTEFQYQQLSASFDEIIEIRSINANQQSEELKLLQRPELFQTFSKVHVFKLTQFESLIYMDADTLPIKQICGLFREFEHLTENQIVASPDSGWPDIFNSGVFLIKPSLQIYNELLHKITNSVNPSFDGADQGLLNEFFQFDSPEQRQWIRLPFLYNVTPSIHYQYQPAYQFFEEEIHVVHFIGAVKPWHEPGLFGNLRDKWWLKYIEFYGHDMNIQKTIDGIDPVYYDPFVTEKSEHVTESVSHPQEEVSAIEEEHQADTHCYSAYQQEEQQQSQVESAHSKVEILTNPDSYTYFETIEEESNWNPAYEEPPKHGKPEAEHFPTDLNQYKDWQDTPQYYDNSRDSTVDKKVVSEPVDPEPVVLMNTQNSWTAPPIFPWEYEHRRVPATRVFTNIVTDPSQFHDPWESLPLLRKIRDKKQQEEEKQQQQRKLVVEPTNTRKSSVSMDVTEAERLKELEQFYDDINELGSVNETTAVVPGEADKDQGEFDMDEASQTVTIEPDFADMEEDEDELEKTLSEVVDDLHSLQSSEFETNNHSIDQIHSGYSTEEEDNGDYDITDEGIDSPMMDEPESAISALESNDDDESEYGFYQKTARIVEEGQIERDLMDELEV